MKGLGYMPNKIFGFITKDDLDPLNERIEVLEYKAEKQENEIENLKIHIAALQQNCYNIGGDVSLLKKQQLSSNST